MTEAWYLDDCAIETRLARRVDGRLAGIGHFPHVRFSGPRVGEVYLARLGKRRVGAGGIFLDLGAAGEGFLREAKAPPAPEGTLVLATVAQEAVTGKLPRFVRGVQIAGRAISLKWDGSERFEMNGDMAMDSRAVEQGHLREELSRVLDRAKSDVPVKIGEAPSAVRKLLTLAKVTSEIQVTGASLLNDLRAAAAKRAPELVAKVKSAPASLFEDEGIEGEIEAALEPVVALPGGGRLVIEMTQALTAIDVDAAGATRANEANEQAARAIPFEIAARGLSGTILIDFAQVRDRRALSRLSAIIAEGAAKLGIEIEIGQGRRGLLDLRRPRAEVPLAAQLTQSGVTHLSVPRDLSYPAQAARASRAIQRAGPVSALEARVPVAFLDWLNEEGRAFKEAIIASSALRLTIVGNALLAPDGLELIG
jgi:ribonuclease E/ribonuclease G